jgi:hypothetical protein
MSTKTETETSRPGRQGEGLPDGMVLFGVPANQTEVSYGP